MQGNGQKKPIGLSCRGTGKEFYQSAKFEPTTLQSEQYG